MGEFNARVSAVRITPSRSEDADSVCRIVFEAHDVEVDWLLAYIGRQVTVSVASAAVPALPLDQALDVAYGDASRNGQPDVEVSAGRRRRRTHSSEQ